MKYLGYYDIDHPSRERRTYALSAKNKMDYIVAALAKTRSVEIISPSGVFGQKGSKGCVERLNEHVSLRLFHSVGRKNRVVGKAGTAFLMIQLFLYLFFHVKKNETILVYHSLGYCAIIRWLKRLKRVRLLLEVEEIYGDVCGDDAKRAKELKLIECADAYIFSTDLLNNELNTAQKPALTIYGTYQIEADRKCKFPDGVLQSGGRRVIHCVYAGTLDPRKGGAIAAAAAAEYLPSNYHLHILGFGSESEKKAMQDAVADIAKRTEAIVTYDGLLTGEDYIRFIQSCDIGLSTQNPDAAFNATSFPSKILSYMANGLRVVSIRIPAIEQSAVGDMLYYYEEQTPEKIAEAILSVDVDAPYDSRGRIQELAERFERELKNLLGRN